MFLKQMEQEWDFLKKKKRTPDISFHSCFKASVERRFPIVNSQFQMTSSAREEQLRRLLQQKQQQAAQALQGLQQHPSVRETSECKFEMTLKDFQQKKEWK